MTEIVIHLAAQIVAQPVRERVEDEVGYIRIPAFSDPTTEGLTAAIDKINGEIGADKVKGYILDLRSNTGGSLNQVVAVADMFLDAGDIVSTRGRTPDSEQSFSATPGDLAGGLPIVVLVNNGTSSGAEIVAGALKDNGRATIVGARTFGKGSIQTLIPLGEDGALRLTTARFYTPSGRNLEGRGIEPDLTVDGRASASREGVEGDVVLQAALAYMRNEAPPAVRP